VASHGDPRRHEALTFYLTALALVVSVVCAVVTLVLADWAGVAFFVFLTGVYGTGSWRRYRARRYRSRRPFATASGSGGVPGYAAGVSRTFVDSELESCPVDGCNGTVMWHRESMLATPQAVPGLQPDPTWRVGYCSTNPQHEFILSGSETN
jgi:hypothetical protein